MAQTLNNPRFPHTCRVYRLDGASPFNAGKEVLVYVGACRKSGSNNIRTFNTGNSSTGKTDVADYRVSMPGIIGICKGDLIDVTDLLGTERGMRIITSGTSRLADATEVLCNRPSN